MNPKKSILDMDDKIDADPTDSLDDSFEVDDSDLKLLDSLSQQINTKCDEINKLRLSINDIVGRVQKNHKRKRDEEIESRKKKDIEIRKKQELEAAEAKAISKKKQELLHEQSKKSETITSLPPIINKKIDVTKKIIEQPKPDPVKEPEVMIAQVLNQALTQQGMAFSVIDTKNSTETIHDSYTNTGAYQHIVTEGNSHLLSTPHFNQMYAWKITHDPKEKIPQIAETAAHPYRRKIHHVLMEYLIKEKVTKQTIYANLNVNMKKTIYDNIGKVNDRVQLLSLVLAPGSTSELFINWTLSNLTQDDDDLIKKIQDSNHVKEFLPEFKFATCHQLLFHFALDLNALDNAGNYDFTTQGYQKHKRGGMPYYQPLGWKRYGLKVSKKFDNGNDDWLMMNGCSGEWAVAYHGTSGAGMTSVVSGVSSDKLKINESTSDAGTAVHGENLVYVSPLYGYAESYSSGKTSPIETSTGPKKYHIVFQCRVNPAKIVGKHSATTHQGDPVNQIWTLKSEDVRPYGILLKEIN